MYIGSAFQICRQHLQLLRCLDLKNVGMNDYANKARRKYSLYKYKIIALILLVLLYIIRRYYFTDRYHFVSDRSMNSISMMNYVTVWRGVIE